jgi:hypothetical protein
LQDIRIVVIAALLLGTLGASYGLRLGGYAPKAIALLLGIGLLAGTFAINMREMTRQDWKLVAWAITAGVAVKAIFVGAVVFGVTGNANAWVIGVNVAQMDPLSANALMDKSSLSPKAKDLLRAWAAGDDPFTVAAVVAMIAAQAGLHINFGIPPEAIGVHDAHTFGVYFVQNFAMMATLVFVFKYAYRGSTTARILVILGLLATTVFVGAQWFWMFGIALTGLFMRPDDKYISDLIERVLERCSGVAYVAAGCIVGLLVWQNGIDLWLGLIIGAAAYASQMLVAPPLMHLLGREFTKADRGLLARAHQNGLTACLLALSTGTIASILPAIITTQVLYFLSNKQYERRLARITS